MESIKYFLSIHQKGSKYQIYIQYFVGLAYIIFGLFKYYNDNFLNSFIWIIGGVIFILINYFNQKGFPSYFIEFTDSLLNLKLSLKKKKAINWNYINNIEIQLTRMLINSKNGSSEVINLSNTNYQNVLSIKETISEFATNKNIPIK